MRADPKNLWWQLQLSRPLTAHNGCQLLNIFRTEDSFYRVCGSNKDRRFPLVEIIWGFSEIFKKIILKFEREFRRLNSFFSRSLDSREDSRAESGVVGIGRSDSAGRISSWLDLRSSRDDLGLDTKELFSVIQPRISMPSIGVLWGKDPPAVTSR